MVLGVVNKGAASAALSGHRDGPAPRAPIGGHGHRSAGFTGLVDTLVDTGLLGLQLGQGGSKITGVHLLVWGFLIAHDPSVRGAGWRTDEEELVGMGGLKELWAAGLLFIQDWSGFAKVNSWADVVLEYFSIEESPDTQGVFFCVERADEAAERG